MLFRQTLRKPEWAYLHLQHLSSRKPNEHADLDAVTAHQQLTAALRQFLGLHGAAIPFDVLKTTGQDLWIRIPAEDQSAVTAAVGGWVSSSGEGWRVVGSSSWNAGGSNVGKGSGQDLFTKG